MYSVSCIIPTALCTALLKRIGVTHVLNAAQGKERELSLVNTSPAFYRHAGIQFLGIEALDHVCFKLDNYFDKAANFIQKALESGGKVLVHCRAGISRSATLVIAFLMIKKGLSVQEALKTVRAKRAIIPNDGFLRQLCELDDRLSLERSCNALTLM
ncbi:DUSP3 [Cordylochernes scorpioides]|uniref:Dual specificity protein phosphatase n=1 Tax=Cordylochernes scorpioides TaxID=51811 RepID=A0ABY6KCJ9_9ARAC|nr:DUSP3 [Cordylochernes scorpioides]